MHKDLLEKVKNLVMDVSAIAKHEGQLQIKEKDTRHCRQKCRFVV